MGTPDPIGSPPAEPSAAAGDHDEMNPPPAAPVPTGDDPKPTPAPPEVQPTADTDAILRDIADKQIALAQAQAAFDARTDAMNPNLEALKRARASRGVDAVQALQELGIDYRELTKRVLQNPAAINTPQANQASQEHLEPIRTEVSELRDQLQAYQREAMTQQIATAARGVVDSVEDAAKYELLRLEPDYGRSIVQVIEQDWTRKGRPRDSAGNAIGTLTLAQGADMLEADLFARATRYSDAQKVRAHYAPPPAATEQPPPAAPPASPGAAPSAPLPEASTLTTTHASTAARADNTAKPAACRARAIAVLEKMSTE